MLSFYLNADSVDSILIRRLLYIWHEILFSKVEIKEGDYATSFMQTFVKQQPRSAEKEFTTYTGIAEILAFFKQKIPLEERALQPVKIGGRPVFVSKYNVFGITKFNAPNLLPLYGQKAIIDLLTISVAKKWRLDEEDLFYFFSQTKPLVENLEIVFTEKYRDILTKSGDSKLEKMLLTTGKEFIKERIDPFKAQCVYGIPVLHNVLKNGYVTRVKPFVSQRVV